MQMNFQAVLFDLDGVLLDSSDTWWMAVDATLKKFNKQGIDKDSFLKTYWGPNLMVSFEKIGLGDEAIQDCNMQYYNFADKIKIFPETKYVLSAIKKKFRVGLVTNTPKEITLFSLRKFQLMNYFDGIICGDEVDHGKPDPEMMLKACKRLGVETKSAVLVGDTSADIVAGKKAGCFVIGLRIGDGDKKVENLGEVEKFLGV